MRRSLVSGEEGFGGGRVVCFVTVEAEDEEGVKKTAALPMRFVTEGLAERYAGMGTRYGEDAGRQVEIVARSGSLLSARVMGVANGAMLDGSIDDSCWLVDDTGSAISNSQEKQFR